MIGVSFEPSNRLKVNMRTLNQFAQKAPKKALLDVGNELLRLSQKEVPHDEGTLQNSGTVEEDGGDVLVGYHCVASHTKVLTADLIWKQAKDLFIGEKIISLDEHRSDFKKTRKIRVGEVLDNYTSYAKCFDVVADKGIITVTENHPFLARTNRKKGYEWLKLTELDKGAEIKFLTRQRLINMWTSSLDKVEVGTKDNNHAVIEDILPAGEVEISNLTTDPPTFISNGFISHNTPYAHRLHEHPEYKFQKGRKGKYLTDPLERNLVPFTRHLGKHLDDDLRSAVK